MSLADESETVSLVISRSLSDQGGVYVHWAVYQSDGYTLAYEDFAPATGSVLLSDGMSVASVVLTPVDDAVPEIAENYIVTITGRNSSIYTHVLFILESRDSTLGPGGVRGGSRIG